LILNILCWASIIEAQQWDWIRSGENISISGIYQTFSDSFGNIYNTYQYYPFNNKEHYIKHSNGNIDSLLSSNTIYKGNLIKSNKRGKILWNHEYWGRSVDIDFYNDHIYLLCEFDQYSKPNSIFYFGGSVIDLTNFDSKRYYYIIYKYDKNGNPIEANIVFNNSSNSNIRKGRTFSSKIFKINNENQIIITLSNSFYNSISNLGINYKDSIEFNNRSLYGGTNKAVYPNGEFLISFTFKGNVNWVVGHESMSEFYYNKVNKTILITTVDVSGLMNIDKADDNCLLQYDLYGNLLKSVRLDRKFKKNVIVYPHINAAKDGNYYIATNETDTFKLGNHIIPITPTSNVIESSRSLFIKLDKNLNYVWHKIINNDNFNFSNNVCIDKKNNIYSIVWFHNQLIIDNQKLDKINNGIQNSSIILKMNSNGYVIETLKLPHEILNNKGPFAGININNIWLDNKDNLYCSGDLSNFESKLFFYIDSFEINPIRSSSTFQAKYNNQILQLNKKYLYCKNDSIEAVADTAYKKFKWVINGKTYWGKTLKPVGLEYGKKYYVALYGFEDDSVTSLRKDSIMYYKPPQAGIIHGPNDKLNICRYSTISFHDNSKIQTNLGYYLTGKLWFGDGKDTIKDIQHNTGIVRHQYNDTGLFTVQYAINHKGCTDTLTLPNYIKVINSPKSDFTIVKDKICTPVLLDLKSNYTGYFDSMTWFLNGKKLISTTKNVEQILIKNSGNQEIMHIIYGYDCSNTTSQTIILEKGFNPKDSIVLNYATISDNKDILLSWNKHNSAIKYLIFDGSKSIETRDTFLKLNNYLIQKESYKFNVIAFDTCGNRINSNTASTILLSGFSEEFNKNSTLNGTPYTFWNQGIKLYKIEFYNIITNTWESLIEKDSNTIKFIDLNFFNQIDYSFKKCYRVIALQNNSNNSSSSNEMCIDYQPFIFAPNSFTPNDDELNDTYEIKVIGAKEYTFSIFSRWGEKLFEGNENNKSWDGKYANNPCNDGVYMIIFSMTTPNGKILNYKSSFTLLR
jgi:gliding motility-associated-like protein